MIYQEINLPIWAQLVLIAILILIGIEIAKIKPVEAPKEVKEEIPDNHIQERYGAYIQSQGRYYN
ncbi:hypothetical protein HMPREF9318_01668 [Streptococcus urinalis FB127-CNA-2]|uniref:Phage membrane protein n=1 Tax=Streptococcus urinalis 2285-97 TaxID=764291 RepID=G5KEV5_9STRE|nr:hypothetical protein [Streptococcus urinalis]QBX12143.1 hypothetical protein JavanS641_0010 [Streptococcus satellite phage Javan641]QBX12154.1 hypothetical protein JavanS643_0006 [Streptococcus satellite phage Javan643]QBX12187.1 hypothetical protein JavanS646_0010 [Streptococcus satellite phage Javan646]QBX12224.1 hypothetical protein JavanS650_0006 [Streptococcus satellite phage Javan650]EHJ55840.1 hypothetical protein STRUR_2164 [Streptococcus urinalis 2285-97]